MEGRISRVSIYVRVRLAVKRLHGDQDRSKRTGARGFHQPFGGAEKCGRGCGVSPCGTRRRPDTTARSPAGAGRRTQPQWTGQRFPFEIHRTDDRDESTLRPVRFRHVQLDDLPVSAYRFSRPSIWLIRSSSNRATPSLTSVVTGSCSRRFLLPWRMTDTLLAM